MISHLSGTALFVRESHLVLDVRGVGYKVYAAPKTLNHARINRNLSLHIHTTVREDALDLFGFLTHEELELFQLLISISGIGPRSALGILALDSIEKLVSAIAHSDVGYLTKVSGVGKKSAEKIVLELREKVGMLNIESVESSRQDDSDVLEALQALGYRAEDAREAVRAVPEDVTGTGARITEVLKILSRR